MLQRAECACSAPAWSDVAETPGLGGDTDGALDVNGHWKDQRLEPQRRLCIQMQIRGVTATTGQVFRKNRESEGEGRDRERARDRENTLTFGRCICKEYTPVQHGSVASFRETQRSLRFSGQCFLLHDASVSAGVFVVHDKPTHPGLPNSGVLVFIFFCMSTLPVLSTEHQPSFHSTGVHVYRAIDNHVGLEY